MVVPACKCHVDGANGFADGPAAGAGDATHRQCRRSRRPSHQPPDHFDHCRLADGALSVQGLLPNTEQVKFGPIAVSDDAQIEPARASRRIGEEFCDPANGTGLAYGKFQVGRYQAGGGGGGRPAKLGIIGGDDQPVGPNSWPISWSLAASLVSVGSRLRARS